jgi:hypothetical protein
MKVFGGPSRTRTCDPLIMSRGRGENLRPFCFIQLRSKPLRVNELTEFQELQDFHHVRLLSVKFGEITDTKTDTVKLAPFEVFARHLLTSNDRTGLDNKPVLRLKEKREA